MLDRNTPDLKTALAKIEKISTLMDTAYRIPGTNIRFGWDSLIGLVPVIGDFIGIFPLLYNLHFAYKFRLKKRIFLLLIANQLLDFAIGSLPIAGDFADIFFKANKRNATLLKKQLHQTNSPR